MAVRGRCQNHTSEETPLKHGVSGSPSLLAAKHAVEGARLKGIEEHQGRRLEAIGKAGERCLLVVAHTVTKENEEVIRILSARDYAARGESV